MHLLNYITAGQSEDLWTKETDIPDVNNSYHYVVEIKRKIGTIKMAQEELAILQKRQNGQLDRKSKFKVGETVLVLLPTDSNKLLMKWKGPFQVTGTVGLKDYEV